MILWQVCARALTNNINKTTVSERKLEFFSTKMVQQPKWYNNSILLFKRVIFSCISSKLKVPGEVCAYTGIYDSFIRAGRIKESTHGLLHDLF